MTVVPLRRLKQGHEMALVMGVFYLLGSYHFFDVLSRSGRVVDWIIAVGWVIAGLWCLSDVRKAIRGKHELHIDGDHAKIVSNGETVFGGSLRDLKRVVGDAGGYDLHPGSAFVYRVKSANVSDELRALLDAACAS